MADHPAVAFLREALDAAEARAKAAGEPWDRDGAGQWTSDCQHCDFDGNVGVHEHCTVVTGDIHIYDEGGHDEYQAAHIAAFDPATVLCMVAADRRLLEVHRPLGDSQGFLVYEAAATTCAECGPGDNWEAQEYADDYPWPCKTVLLRAQAWGWHED